MQSDGDSRYVNDRSNQKPRVNPLCYSVTLSAERLKMRTCFCASGSCELARPTISLPLWPPLPTERAVWPSPPAQGLGQSKACWDGGGGLVFSWHCATFSLVARPDWGQRGRLLCLRLMRTGLWSGYRVLQNRRPAGTSCPLCCVPPSPP